MSRRLRALAAFAVIAIVPVSTALAAGETARTDPPRIASPYELSQEVRPGDRHMGVRLLGTLRLAAVRWRGHTLSGLSALAWDEDEDTLYALSDRGVVFHLSLEFDEEGRLADARLRDAFALRAANGRALRGRAADAEGLLVRHGDNGRRGDSELVVSFERRPRVIRYDPQGQLVGSVGLPRELRDRHQYQNSNRGLESIAWHPQLGYMTAPELPLKTASPGEVGVYAIERERHWRYPLASEPNAGLVAMEWLPDGSLLTLERGHGFFFVPVITTLRRIAAFPDGSGASLDVATVARFNSGQGWSLDNFEGLTHLGGGRILIVSDDNEKAFQATLLAAFEIVDATAQAR